jgi:hypothetical protein
MKTRFLALLALPLALAGCSTYVGTDSYGPDYYAYGYPTYGPGYYDGVYGDVAVYGYDRGGYNAHYHHYDGSYQHSDRGTSAVASRGYSHESHVASTGHVGGSGGGRVAHASASVSHSGGGDHR